MDMTLPAPGSPANAERRTWIMVTSAAGGAAAVATAIPFVSTLAPSERAKAAGAPVEVDISSLAPGELRTVEWRGKPGWIVRRTPEMLASLQGHDDQLVDPKSERQQQPDYAQNATRSINPEVFVAVGICTHLGCSPSKVNKGSGNPSVPADWPGGFFCPCHGSTFDGAGRVFKNKPAPTNLEIPPHAYIAENRLLIGEDKSAAA
uniref:Ubiquinol-cytochrome c reductase iron-sulfur subunit n=1 Tax=Rubrivivax gelatinosus TaxID=28068 RepID=Q5DKY8_RUBGE|nr:Rieske iron-sulfur protein [Rubrivivax gelatinosus]